MTLVKALKWGIPIITAVGSFSLIKKIIDNGAPVSPEFFAKDFSDRGENKQTEDDIYLVSQDQKAGSSEVQLPVNETSAEGGQ